MNRHDVIGLLRERDGSWGESVERAKLAEDPFF